MAAFGSSGFYGFVGSVKKTGRKILNKAGLLVPEIVEDFISGFSGRGWRIWERVSGIWRLEIDELVVRRTMVVFELLISKIRAIKGSLAITQASGKIKSVADRGDFYEIALEDDGGKAAQVFMPNDFIRCQSFDMAQRFYHVMVAAADGNVITVNKSEFGGGMTAPEAGDEIVQFGNATDESRQGAIYLHADESAFPAIDIMQGINSKDWSKCIVARVGGVIPNVPYTTPNGFYCVNGCIVGKDTNGRTVYSLNPDGSGTLAHGSIQWDSSGRFAINIGPYGLQDKLTSIDVTMEGFASTVKSLGGTVNSHDSKIQQNANAISAEVTARGEETKSTRALIEANGASIMAMRNDIIAAGVEIDGDTKRVSIVGDKFDVWDSGKTKKTMSVDENGVVTANSLVANGAAIEGVINASVYTTKTRIISSGTSEQLVQMSPSAKGANTYIAKLTDASHKAIYFELPDPGQNPGLELNIFAITSYTTSSRGPVVYVRASPFQQLYIKKNVRVVSLTDRDSVAVRDESVGFTTHGSSVTSPNNAVLRRDTFYKFKALGNQWYCIEGEFDANTDWV